MNSYVLSSNTSIGVTFLASFLIWIMFLGLAVLWLIDGRLKKEQAFHALIATLISWGLANMVKSLFPTERPFETLGIQPLTMTWPRDGSFPSEHSAAAWALAFTVFQHDRKVGLLFILAAAGVSIGRVLSNVHYAQDVVAGLIIGVTVAYLFEKLHLFKVLSGKR